MKKLKICIVSGGVFPDHKDGSSNYIRGLYETLKKRGHDVKLLTAKWDQGFSDPNIITVDVPHSRFLWVPKFARTFKKYLKTHEFDIIQTNGARGAIPVLLAKKPYIALIHDMGPFEADFAKIPILKWLEKRHAQKAKKIITNSNMTKKGIVDLMGAKEEIISTVYCGYDQTYKPYPEEGAQLKTQLDITGPVIYYVGRIAFYKGVEDIIGAYYSALEKIPDLNLVIGGKPTLKMKDTYHKWQTQYPEVKFVGLVKEEDMARYYSMADAFVTYSFASEGFGITPIEAIACGTPVICSDMPAYQEILEENAIFIKRERPDLLSEAFIEFFTNPKTRDELITKAQGYITRYTWDAVTARVEEVYTDYLHELQNENN